MAAKVLRLKQDIRSKLGTMSVNLNLSKVRMTEGQRKVASKLFNKIKGKRLDVDAVDRCEIGKCPASKHLTPDEFELIRGLRATIGTGPSVAGPIIDFCLKVINV